MRCVLGVSLLMLAPLSVGCLSTPRPQPMVRSTPADNGREVAIDAPSAPAAPSASGTASQTVAETSSSTSLSSRFTKLFSRPDSSDRMPLPRSDQPLDGDQSAQRDVGGDF
jgi:hypothetical protein